MRLLKRIRRHATPATEAPLSFGSRITSQRGCHAERDMEGRIGPTLQHGATRANPGIGRHALMRPAWKQHPSPLFLDLSLFSSLSLTVALCHVLRQHCDTTVMVRWLGRHALHPLASTSPPRQHFTPSPALHPLASSARRQTRGEKSGQSLHAATPSTTTMTMLYSQTPWTASCTNQLW